MSLSRLHGGEADLRHRGVLGASLSRLHGGEGNPSPSRHFYGSLSRLHGGEELPHAEIGSQVRPLQTGHARTNNSKQNLHVCDIIDVFQKALKDPLEAHG